jgi:cytochrome c551/c552
MSRILRLATLVLVIIGAVYVVGCGQKAEQAPAGAESSASTAAGSATPAPAGAWAPPGGDYAALDQGPRAADTPVDAALAAKGKELFGNATAPGKTCFTCHAFDKKIIGPPLGPVAKQRTAAWILAQIQHPDVMTANDPVAKALLAEYKAQMLVPGGVTEEEAKSLLEYVKSGGK